MASPSELSLDCKPHSYSMLLKSFGDQTLQPSSDQNQTHKLEDFLARLEEERLKIDAFKRELPLCMQLLTNAVETSRQQLQAFRGSNPQEARHAVLEEFIPLTLSSSEASEKATSFSDKTTWMTSAQLWSQSGDVNQVITKQQSSPTHKDQTDIGFSPKLALDHKQRNGGGFLPFSKERNLSSISSPNQAIRALPDLALNNSEDHKVMEDRKQCSEKGNNGGVVIDQTKSTAGNNNSSENLASANNTTNNSSTNQTNRKARRCWSPDLHRRFVNALQMLGGSQVATPKQIRELMKVDGLTNDEVKSHLQKYRLHTRRPSPSPQAAGGPAPQLVVLGGIWVPSEYATAAAAAAHHSAGTPTLYATAHHHPSAHAPTHYCAPPQDHYYAASAAANQAPQPQIHHHTLHHQLHVYNNKSTTSQTHSSPESELRGAEDRSESIEDGKSESGSWKGDSGGENGGAGERKGLAALREEGEESNGSDITLKF